MSLYECPQNGCSVLLRNKKHARQHYRNKHAGEIETPKDELGTVESEQRDFAGEEPSTEGHNPQYEVEKEPEPETRLTTLQEHERERDRSIDEYTEDNGEDTE